MRPSPIQAKHIGFYSIEITPRKLEDDEKSDASFDWNGVIIGSPVKHFSISDTSSSRMVTLDIIVKNEEGKIKAPYNIEISSWGVFECLNKSIPDEEALDMMVVNGASMLYGSIRELLFSLTSRMTNNELMLPTANFLDCKPSLKVPAVTISKSNAVEEKKIPTKSVRVSKRAKKSDK